LEVRSGTGLDPAVPASGVARLAAHVRFVGLDVAREWPAAVVRHRPTDAMHEEQGRLVGEPGLPFDLEGADALLRRARGPERIAPMHEGDARVLHDRADAYGELLAAPPAAPQEARVPLAGLPVAHLVDLCIAAARAG